MTATVRMLLGFAVVSTSFLSGSFPHVGAQSAGEAATTAEPSLEAPAPEEPALQLKLDDAGVDVDGYLRTADGYTLEEIGFRVKRASKSPARQVWLPRL